MNERAVEDVVHQMTHYGLEWPELAKEAEELDRSWEDKVEVHGTENMAFHGENFIAGVGVSAYVDEVFDFGRVDLFVLGGDHETGGSEELEAVVLDFLHV